MITPDSEIEDGREDWREDGRLMVTRLSKSSYCFATGVVVERRQLISGMRESSSDDNVIEDDKDDITSAYDDHLGW